MEDDHNTETQDIKLGHKHENYSGEKRKKHAKMSRAKFFSLILKRKTI